MKRKFLTVLLALVAALCLCFGLAACGAAARQKPATILSVEGASIDGTNIFMLVSPQTTKVQLADKVVCSDDSYWQLFYDELGQREIPPQSGGGTRRRTCER